VFGGVLVDTAGYDAFLHAVLLGFVFAMIFGHAPIIFPAVLGIRIPFAAASTCTCCCYTCRWRYDSTAMPSATTHRERGGNVQCAGAAAVRTEHRAGGDCRARPATVRNGGDVITQDQVMAALRQVMDPEIGINVVDLGLVYDVTVQEDDVRVAMTMTTRACPLHDMIVGNAESASALPPPSALGACRNGVGAAVESRDDGQAAKRQLGWFQVGARHFPPLPSRHVLVRTDVANRRTRRRAGGNASPLQQRVTELACWCVNCSPRRRLRGGPRTPWRHELP